MWTLIRTPPAPIRHHQQQQGGDNNNTRTTCRRKAVARWRCTHRRPGPLSKRACSSKATTTLQTAETQKDKTISQLTPSGRRRLTPRSLPRRLVRGGLPFNRRCPCLSSPTAAAALLLCCIRRNSCTLLSYIQAVSSHNNSNSHIYRRRISRDRLQTTTGPSQGITVKRCDLPVSFCSYHSKLVDIPAVLHVTPFTFQPLRSFLPKPPSLPRSFFCIVLVSVHIHTYIHTRPLIQRDLFREPLQCPHCAPFTPLRIETAAQAGPSFVLVLQLPNTTEACLELLARTPAAVAVTLAMVADLTGRHGTPAVETGEDPLLVAHTQGRTTMTKTAVAAVVVVPAHLVPVELSWGFGVAMLKAGAQA